MRVDQKDIVNLQGKDFVLFRGLLDLAHQDGLKSIATELLQIPTEENGNCAIIQAHVVTDKGSFTGIGDADPSNVNRMIAKHLIRMAETRAVGRALRFATNVGITAFDELGGDDADDQPPKATAKQKESIQEFCQKIAWDGQELNAYLMKNHNTTWKMLTYAQAQKVSKELEKKAA